MLFLFHKLIMYVFIYLQYTILNPTWPHAFHRWQGRYLAKEGGHVSPPCKGQYPLMWIYCLSHHPSDKDLYSFSPTCLKMILFLPQPLVQPHFPTTLLLLNGRSTAARMPGILGDRTDQIWSWSYFVSNVTHDPWLFCVYSSNCAFRWANWPTDCSTVK